MSATDILENLEEVFLDTTQTVMLSLVQILNLTSPVSGQKGVKQPEAIHINELCKLLNALSFVDW